MRELGVDRAVLLAPQLAVPAREAVLDLSVGARVLLEDRDEGAFSGESLRHLGARGGASDHGDGTSRESRTQMLVRHPA